MVSYPISKGRFSDAQLAEVYTLALRGIRSIKPSSEAWEAGMVWYEKAHEFCQGFSEITHRPVDRLVWALAALSPLNNWRQNKLDLVDLVTTGSCGALGPCVTKAERVLDGEPAHEVLGGNKVLAFGDNIIDPAGSRKVTIDRHIASVVGLPTVKYLERVGVYEAIAKAFRKSAASRGIRPHQLQAALWMEVR